MTVARLLRLQVAANRHGRDYLCFQRAVRVAKADLAGAVIAGLPDGVIALLVTAFTTLGRH
jgi:hypothetical protein